MLHGILGNVGRIGSRAYGVAIEEEMLERREDLVHLEELERQERESERRQNAPTASFADELRERIPTPSDQLSFNEDYGWENTGRYSGNNGEAPQVTDGREMTRFDRVLYYAMYVQHFGLSNEEIKRMEDLMTVLYGTAPPISYQADVELLYKDMLCDLNRQRYYFCCSCNKDMCESQPACENPECSIRGLNIKRAKRMQRIEVQVVNFIPQLADILVRDVEKIIQMHGYLHEHRGTQTEDRSDIRLFDGYYQNIETPEAFRRNRLKVLLSMSIDGFRPRRISKREIWPLYLRIEGIPPSEANKYYNSIITGTIYARVKPTEKIMETLLSRIESELHDLRDSPLEIEVGGNLWTLDVALYRGIADMAAQQVLFGVPRWSSEYECSKCYIRGTRIGSRRVWIAGSDADTVLRDRDSYSASEVQQYGIPST